MTLRIAISLGDVTGIGPEVTLKALAGQAWGSGVSFVLIGDIKRTLLLKEALGLDLPLGIPGTEKGGRQIELREIVGESLPHDLRQGAPEAGRAAVAWVRAG